MKCIWAERINLKFHCTCSFKKFLEKNGNQGRVQCQVSVVVSFPCFTLGYWAITEVPRSWWHLLQSRTLWMHSCEYTDLCLLLLGMRTMNKVYMCAFPHSWVLGRASKAVQHFSKLQRTWFCYLIYNPLLFITTDLCDSLKLLFVSVIRITRAAPKPNNPQTTTTPHSFFFLISANCNGSTSLS